MDDSDDLLINGLVSAQWKRRALRMIQRLVVLSGDDGPPVKAAGRGIAFWGELIRELREEQGLTQRQLATLAGVNRTTLRRIENKSARGDIDVIERLLEFLGYELEAIHRDALEAFNKRLNEAEGDPQQRSQLAAIRLFGLQSNGAFWSR